uniref:Uncharacterized protein n=1 Tax=Pseudictyota dubia TaxID=2749911 RepID=A0A7R9WJJ7_9STRA|mmetsp:Transcript_51508/g.95323  ORF Transcript_51508/g.95323 Transcript_51508/m.95323 type:complete len:275 (+) Transcript_51508:296-1120(+)|eukprot:CAMPEP_0197438516 /NCGR_PEP_ID=MMETSP1175-20131217/5494_1 /TAXON_ID=1003142 /ORGANISM="Triceratium dubium, Strain CCMP147" /LENGTH=274 /DNA_ID=CAMNT_0042968265 /DNA_START=296 /DNA_END=1120 /DNA_ORIENTATION=-
MSPPQKSKRRSHKLRPYQVSVKQDDSVARTSSVATKDDIVAKTAEKFRELAEARGHDCSTVKAHGFTDATAESSRGPSRKFRDYPQSYHDQPYERSNPLPSFPVTARRDGPDLASPYRGGDGSDAPPGFEFAVKSYQHEVAESARSGAVGEAANAAHRAEEDARRMAEATRELMGQPLEGENGVGPRGREDAFPHIGEGVQSCVRSMLSCLHASAEGTLLGYSAAPEVGAGVGEGGGGNPYVSSSIYGGFSDNGNTAASSENSGLLSSVNRMMR